MLTSEEEQERYEMPGELAARGVEHFDPHSDGFGFLIEVEPTEAEYRNTSCSLKVREVTSLGGDGLIGSEPYLGALMKWDSCMHVYFAEIGDDGYLHLCGIKSWTKHIALMKRIYFKAFELMEREPQDGEEWLW